MSIQVRRSLVVGELLLPALVLELEEADLLPQRRHAALKEPFPLLEEAQPLLAVLAQVANTIEFRLDLLLVLPHLCLHLLQLKRDLRVQALDFLKLTLALRELGLQAILRVLGVLQLPTLEVELVLHVPQVTLWRGVLLYEALGLRDVLEQRLDGVLLILEFLLLLRLRIGEALDEGRHLLVLRPEDFVLLLVVVIVLLLLRIRSDLLDLRLQFLDLQLQLRVPLFRCHDLAVVGLDLVQQKLSLLRDA
mmetsp:Transcript_111130/g.248316  ORF Transcript_111130/g.248316 Transcript_111130/m.248316 type:complete len:249 (-) Transcript_111130:558-1304(-)